MTSGGVLQLQNFQITDVIFRIITGLFCDIGVDCFAGPGRINTEFPKNLCHLIVSGALSVDQEIQQSVHAQLQAAGMFLQPGRLCGIRLSGLFQQSGCIIIGKKFHIQRPAFEITAVPDEFSGRIRVHVGKDAVAVHGLVEMTREPFMSQCGVELQSLRGVPAVYIYDIIVGISQRRG